MNLRLYAGVLSRHRTLLLVGFVSAMLLAGLSYYRVTSDGVLPTLTPRKVEIWQSQANVFLTESGFPLGRRTIPLETRIVAGEAVAVPRYNDPTRYGAVASLYARLAASDQVLQRMAKSGPVPGTFQAAPTIDDSRDPLPMISLFGKSATASGAVATVTRGLNAFIGFVTAQQAAAKIRPRDRIELRIVNAPQSAVLIQPRKKTLPVVVFLAVLIAAIASAFVIENARRGRPSFELVEDLEDAREQPHVQTPARTPAPAPASQVQTPARTPSPAPEPAPAQVPEPEPELELEPVRVRRWA